MGEHVEGSKFSPFTFALLAVLVAIWIGYGKIFMDSVKIWTGGPDTGGQKGNYYDVQTPYLMNVNPTATKKDDLQQLLTPKNEALGQIITLQPTKVSTNTFIPTDTRQFFQIKSAKPDWQGLIRTTHYEPWKGGDQCLTYKDGICWSRLTNGLPWETEIGVAAACPLVWPLESLVIFANGDQRICMDTGVMTCDPSICQVDVLGDYRDQMMNASVYFPN